MISLPKYTFAPYTTQKTYVLVLERRDAPLAIEPGTPLEKCFMYVSDRDGKAASDKRFILDALEVLPGYGWARIHDDFGPNFGNFDGTNQYLSLLEETWKPGCPISFNQARLTDTWKGSSWEVIPGKKWSREALLPQLVRVVEEKPLPADLRKTLERLIARPIEAEEDLREALQALQGEFQQEGKRASALRAKWASLVHNIVWACEDSGRHLPVVRTATGKLDVPCVPEKLFRPDDNPFAELERGREMVPLVEDFVVRLGKGITEVEAYQCVGNIPVYTAAISGPSYFVGRALAATKTLEVGPALVWSRLGNAGTLTLVKTGEFFTSDKSGVIKPRRDCEDAWSLEFLLHYLPAKLKAWVTSEENIGQLNTEYVCSTLVARIPLKSQQAWLRKNVKSKNRG